MVLPTFARSERLRLWLSYQRYAFVLVGGSAALALAMIALAPWWLAAPVVLLAIVPARFGLTVWARYPRKLRATQVAAHRIAHGRFQPSSVTSYCGDPCFRVVAHEILRRAGHDRSSRRALIAQFRCDMEARGGILLIVDHAGSVVATVGGHPLAPTK